MTDDGEWPPPEARVRAALWAAEGHLLRGEWAQADRMLVPVARLAGEPALVRGLRRLAAAGYKAAEGDRPRAERHLAGARALLDPFLADRSELDVEALLAIVERALAEDDVG
jgi:hypothetical protein